jgi:Zn-dependent protease with chaperone function
VLVFLALYPSVALGAILILGSVARWFIVPTDQRRTEYVLVAAIFTMLLSFVAQMIANSMSRLRPLKYDLFIYRFDAVFGQPSFALGRFV